MSDEILNEPRKTPVRPRRRPTDAQVTQRLLMITGRRIAARKRKFQGFKNRVRGGSQ